MTTPLGWIPRFTVGASVTQLAYPVTRWSPGQRTTGRTLTSAYGVIGASVKLRRYTLALTLRFVDDEWDAVRAFIKAAMLGQPFTWETGTVIPDTTASYTVTLDAPRVGDGIKPQRDATWTPLLTLGIVLAKPTAWDVEYFRQIPGEWEPVTMDSFQSDSFQADSFQ